MAHTIGPLVALMRSVLPCPACMFPPVMHAPGPHVHVPPMHALQATWTPEAQRAQGPPWLWGARAAMLLDMGFSDTQAKP